jgi:long-chain acyl-CoA synthetase
MLRAVRGPPASGETVMELIPSRLFKMARERPQAPAYYVRGPAGWKPTSYRTYASEVRAVAKSLIALGFQPRQTTCILGFNRPEWVLMDFATMCAGGAPAGIYTTCSPSEVAYIIRHAESPIVLVENKEQWEKVRAERANLPDLKHVVMMQGAPAIDDPMVLGWEQFLSKGEGILDAKVDERIKALEPSQLATLIYTSGTTGPPKGVMLSHENLAWTADCAKGLVGSGPDDRSLSYLPLSHIAEQMFTIHGPITGGSAVYFAESIEKVPENLKEVQPTIFFGVPRIWEKFHAGISARLGQATGVKKTLATWAMNTAGKVAELRSQGKEPEGFLAAQYRLAQKLVFSKLKPAIGLGSARICVSGAAPIAKEVLEFFAKLDILVLEVYGQSEDTGPTSFNQPNKFKLGTVGPIIPGIEVKIAEDGEILVKGKNVFMGYYKEPEATAETLSPDGWLHSGDLGAIDQNGFLSITGRKKEIIITAGGKNIAPKNLEASLKNHPLINEAVVIGDRRKYLTALITLDPDASKTFAADAGISNGKLHQDKRLLDEIQRAVDATNAEVARVEQIKKFKVLDRNFSVETGELTPTLKVKRKIVNQNFASEIESMYVE